MYSTYLCNHSPTGVRRGPSICCCCPGPCTHHGFSALNLLMFFMLCDPWQQPGLQLSYGLLL